MARDTATQLYELTAAAAVDLLAKREVSPSELINAALSRIEAVDPHLNALPTRCVERAREHAKRIESQSPAMPRPRGWLGGLPVAIKDLNAVQGVRTTQGSAIYADHYPQRSDILVELLESNGAIVLAKSNTPEFGAGASTFNDVFGKTRNPWNTAKSVAGSSGGASAAVASGQVWLAHGSDLGGSLRTPAGFNSVLGLRPSPGRVPHGPVEQAFDTLFVDGPIGRTAEDVALLLDAMSGFHPEDPLTFDAPAVSFRDAVARRTAPARIGYSPDLGIVPVERAVGEICLAAAHRFAELGAVVDDACPDFSEVIDCFQVLRAALFAAMHAGHLRDHRDKLKPEVIWNIERGLALTAEQIGAAEAARSRLCQSMHRFFQSHDLLICPTAIVPPFDVDVRYVEEVEGQRFDNYVHWISITFAASLTGCPAMSVPAGFTADGLPVGMQIIGPPRGEAKVLAGAATFDEITGYSRCLPIDPRDAQGNNLLNTQTRES